MPTALVNRQLRLNMETFKSNATPIITAAYLMTIRDTDLKVNSTTGAFQVTLPPVAECAGMEYVIRQMASATTVTIVDKGDASVATSVTLTSATAAIALKSNGERWFTEFTVA